MMSFLSTLCISLGAIAGMAITGRTNAATFSSEQSRIKYTPEAQQDEVQNLPGWNKPLPSRMFAGFVDAGEADEGGTHYKMHEHYFFVESEGDPLSDPIVVWTNGGPGASSFFGLFVELGPFFTSGASLHTASYNQTKIPTLFRNDYSWSKLASILIINSPPPVGYSYCDPIGQAGNGSSCGTWNDSKTAVHNEIYLESWLARFPQYKNNDWYIVGESYAGVYVPTLARRILENPASNISSMLKGIAIGDGCVGTDVLCGANGPGPLSYLEFFGGHGQMSQKLYHQAMTECPADQLLGFGVPVTDPKCKALLSKMNKQIGPYYAYNLYDACWYQNSLNPPHSKGIMGEHSGGHQRSYWGPPTKAVSTSRHGHGSRRLQALNDYPCGGPQALFEWIETPEVKEALHVDPDAEFFSGDNGAGLVYNLTEPNLMPFYLKLAKETKVRVLIYNGDTDPSINSFASQNWTSHLGLQEKQEWRPWTLDGKSYLGGYVTRYDGDFDFLTIRGSGHMVPQYKPKVTLEFLRKWLSNEDWLHWDGKNDEL